MGVYLPKPKTNKESEDGGQFPGTSTRFGLSAMQGWRQYMEDAHIADPAFKTPVIEYPLGIFGVFDGHGGPAVSSWVSSEFRRVFGEQILETTNGMKAKTIQPKRDFENDVSVVCEALQRTFLRLDVEMESESSREALKKIHEECEKLKNQELSEDGAPCSLLEALLASFSGKTPIIQVMEREGQRLYRIMPQEEAAPEDDAAADGNNAEIKKSEGTEEKETINNRMEEDPIENPQPLPGDMCEPAEDAASVTANNLQPHQPECCGSTAVVAAVIGRGDNRYLITANAGDSRGVLCRNGIAIAMSRDHKPVARGENRRITNAGGKVVNGRVDGNLNLSRALGDLFYKSDATIGPEEQKITSFPDVRVVPLCPKDQFVILACDGIWDCMTNQEAVDFVLKELEKYENEPINSINLSEICEKICDECLCANPLQSEGGIGCDNMTVLLVLLNENLSNSNDSEENKEDNCSVPFFYGEEPEEQDYEECLPEATWKSETFTEEN